MPANFVKREIKVWWAYLKDKGLISSKKYSNLMRTSLNRFEEEGFINRQLVETRQISKHVTNILINCYEKHGTKTVPIKATLVDDFRKQFDIYKNREINDYHHAKDAFITSVIGIYMLNRFPSLEKELVYNEYRKYKSHDNNRINKYGFILGSMNNNYKKDGNVIWKKDESINRIKKQLNYKDCNITKRVCENKGELFNVTIQPKPQDNKKISNPIPIKKDLDINKYGYYTGEQIAYSSILEYKQGEKRVKSLIGVPIRYSKEIGNSKEKLKEYFENVRKLEDVKILKDKVYKYQLFENEKGIFYLASPTEWHNAKQLLLDLKSEEIIYKIFNDKYCKEVKNEELIYVYNQIIEKIELHYSIYFNLLTKIKNKKDMFIKFSIEDKIRLIKELLKLTKANAQKGDMRIIEESKEFGKLNGKNMKIEDTTFIYPSITGLFIKEERY